MSSTVQVQQQRSPIITTNKSPVRKIEVLSPKQQKSLITTTPVRKVAEKNHHIYT
jgi:hypothetical protein